MLVSNRSFEIHGAISETNIRNPNMHNFHKKNATNQTGLKIKLDHKVLIYVWLVFV